MLSLNPTYHYSDVHRYLQLCDGANFVVNVRQAGNNICFFHRDVTDSGCIDACLRVLMLSQLLSTSGVLPITESMI